MCARATNWLDEEYKSLTIKNNFLFCKVFSDKKLCKMVLETILDIKIDHLENPVAEKVVSFDFDQKSVRFDVYVENDDYMFDIEMQVVHKNDLPQRARYYQAANDAANLAPGEDYSQLKANVVIFLCDFDPFNRDLPCYTFVNTCREDKMLDLGDNTMKIFYNFNAYAKITETHERGIMEYMATRATSEYISTYMAELVEQAHNMPTWSKEYQCTIVALKDAEAEGLARGIEQGIQQGIAKGKEEADSMYKPLLAKKDEALAEKDALIAELKAQLGKQG